MTTARRRPTGRMKPLPKPVVEEPAGDEYTDSTLAEVLSEKLSDDHLYVSDLGWFRLHRKAVWKIVSEGEVVELVRQFVKESYAEMYASSLRDKEKDYHLAGWRSAESKSRLSAIVALCRGILLRDASELDRHHWLLNCPNGIVDLRTGVLMPHSPKYLFTKCTTARYVPGATHPDWEAALSALPKDATEWYQMRKGQAVTGFTPADDVVLFEQGGGANGKSTLVGAITGAIGDYFALMPDSLLLSQDPREASVGKMALRGVRYAQIEELPDSGVLNMATLKKIAGTERITARLLYKNDVTFDQTHTLSINTNPKPAVKETEWAVWRRLVMIPFTQTYKDALDPSWTAGDLEADAGIRSGLARGAGGRREAVLAWLVEGAVNLYEYGEGSHDVFPAVPDSVREHTQAWRDDNDIAGQFLAETCEFDADFHVAGTDLMVAMTDFLKANGHHQWTTKTLRSRLMDNQKVKEFGVREINVKAGSKAHGERSDLTRIESTFPPAIGKQYRGLSGLRFLD